MNDRAYRTVITPETSDVAAKSLITPGPFPVEDLNPVQRAVAEETAQVHQIDVALPAMAALATVAGAIGKGHVIQGAVNGRVTHCNIFLLAGATKSYGKNAASSIAAPIIYASREMADDFRMNQLPSLIREQRVLEGQSKALIRKLSAVYGQSRASLNEDEKREAERELDGMQARIEEINALVRPLPSYWIGSSTTAGMVDGLARNGETIFSYSPEAGDLVRIALGKYATNNSADFDLLLAGYSVEEYRETRREAGDKAMRPCISTLWFCQPYLLREMAVNEEAQERGLTARALAFVCEHDVIPEDDGVVRQVSEQVQEEWNRLVLKILDTRAAPEPVVIHCTPEARELFRDWHNESVRLRNGPFRDMEGELGRWRENAIRLAGGQCVADAYMQGVESGDIVLSVEHARRGVSLARWASRSTLAILHEGIEDRRTARAETLRQLLNSCSGKMTLRELKRRHGYDNNEVKALVSAYPKTLSVQRVEPGKEGGRPSEVCVLRGG